MRRRALLLMTLVLYGCNATPETRSKIGAGFQAAGTFAEAFGPWGMLAGEILKLAGAAVAGGSAVHLVHSRKARPAPPK